MLTASSSAPLQREGVNDKCGICDGLGKVAVKRKDRTPDGSLRSVLEEVSCTNCKGSGSLNAKRETPNMYDSKAQMRFAHTPAGKRKFGSKTVAEFDAASKGETGSIPERAPKQRKFLTANPPRPASDMDDDDLPYRKRIGSQLINPAKGKR